MHLAAALSPALSRVEYHATHSAVPQPFNQYGGTYNFEGLAESHPIPLSSLYFREESLIPDCVSCDDIVNS